MLKNAGVEVINGYAKLVDPHTVDIDGKKVTAQTILVAVGGWPAMPKVEGGELAITSNEAFFLEERPNRVIVVVCQH
jgi:glutathione reductase (NADPH)